VIGQIQGEPPVAFAERLHAHPHHLAGGDDGVEVSRVVVLQPGRQDFSFEDRRRQRRSLELLDHVEQRVGADTLLHEALPRDRESTQRCLVDRLHFLSELCQ